MTDKNEKVFNFLKNNQEKFFLALGFFLVLVAGFFSGYFYSKERQMTKDKIKIEEPSGDCKDLFNAQFLKPENLQTGQASGESEAPSFESAVSGVRSTKEMFVGSKNSNVYHRPDCASAKRIKEENKVWFSSVEEAEKKGYRPARSCFN